MSHIKGQRGFSLPAAIFIITVMAALSVAIGQLLQRNAESSGESALQLRALYAAESAAGFALNARFPPAEFPAYDTDAICPDNAASPRVYAFTVDGLQGCEASVSCTVDAEIDDVAYYTIRSSGSCGGVTKVVQVGTRLAL